MVVEFTINVGFRSYCWHVHAKWGLGSASKISDYYRKPVQPNIRPLKKHHKLSRMRFFVEWKI